MKKPTTYDEQIQLLKNHGLIIEDEEKAKNILSNLNYYSFTGYLLQFKNKNGDYIENITFDKIYKIYLFDKKFRSILLQELETIEIALKTKLAYVSAHKIGEEGYKDKSNFKDKKEFDIFIGKFKNLKRKNKHLDYVQHHNENYNGNMPIWVAINLFTMGMIYNFYKNIAENTNPNLEIKGNNTQSIKKQLAKQYNTSDKILESWIENILYVRNMFAHYMRIYNVKLQKIPLKCKVNHNNNYIVTHRIFDVVHIMKFLVLDIEEWNNTLTNIEALFEQYQNYININLLGFPENWREILKK
nr:Abi family protein [uncultured Tyzzerella sp.]